MKATLTYICYISGPAQRVGQAVHGRASPPLPLMDRVAIRSAAGRSMRKPAPLAMAWTAKASGWSRRRPADAAYPPFVGLFTPEQHRYRPWQPIQEWLHANPDAARASS